MRAETKCTQPKYVCSNERVKLIGTLDGWFPDFGHHLPDEMGGLWLQPVKILDGFWLKMTDHANEKECFFQADRFVNEPWGNTFRHRRQMGDSPVEAACTLIAPEDICGVKVTYEFVNRGEQACDFETCFLARTDLRPGWRGECSGVYDGAGDVCEFDEKEDGFITKDCDHPWYAMIGSSLASQNHDSGQFFGPQKTKGAGVTLSITHRFSLQPKESRKLVFYIACSDRSEEHLRGQYRLLREGKDFEKKKEEKQEALLSGSCLKVGDPEFENVYQWIKIDMDWLILQNSDGDRGFVAGLPEYPWWFGCDSCYTVQGLLAMGQYDLCRDNLSLLLRHSKRINGNGRIVHEILPDGYCTNPGNVQETAQYVYVVWLYYEWTGDRSFIEEAFPYLGKSVQWLQEQDDDNDYFPTGYGIIEIANLNVEMIDTAVYTCMAYESYASMCRLMHKETDAEYYGRLSQQVRDAINEKLWDEENGLYCDCYTSYNKIAERKEMIDQLLESAGNEEIRQYVKKILKERENDGDLERGWLLNRNWVISTPMETGIAPKEKAERALKKLDESVYINQWGMHLAALKQDEVMTISTGVMAVAQARCGHPDRALELIKKMFSAFSAATPGSIAELAPDGGCFVMAWTVYGVFYPIVRYFFGIQPKKSEGLVEINPCPPAAWPAAELSHVRVLESELDISYSKSGNKCTVSVRNPGNLRLKFGGEGLESVNGKEEILTAARQVTAVYRMQ